MTDTPWWNSYGLEIADGSDPYFVLERLVEAAEKRGYDKAFATIPNPSYSLAEIERILKELSWSIEMLRAKTITSRKLSKRNEHYNEGIDAALMRISKTLI